MSHFRIPSLCLILIVFLLSCKKDQQSSKVELMATVDSDAPNRITIQVDAENASHLWFRVEESPGSHQWTQHFSIDALDGQYRQTFTYVWPNAGSLSIQATAYQATEILNTLDQDRLPDHEIAQASVSNLTIDTTPIYYHFTSTWQATVNQDDFNSGQTDRQGTVYDIDNSGPTYTVITYRNLVCDFTEECPTNDQVEIVVPKEAVPGEYLIKNRSDGLVVMDTEPYVFDPTDESANRFVLTQNGAEGIAGQVYYSTGFYGETGQDFDTERQSFFARP